MLSLTFLFVFMLICILFSIVVTPLGEERAGLYVSLAFVCLSCMRYFLCVFFSWCRVSAAESDCGRPAICAVMRVRWPMFLSGVKRMIN